MSIYDFKVKTAKGDYTSLEKYRGNVMLIVNTASKCGFTPQYKDLQDLYLKHKDQGLIVLAFPCNQFGAQEPGSDNEIQSFCEFNYGVTFPVMGKIDVNGPNADPLFQHLKKEAPGLLNTKTIKWNFTKFLVDRNGKVQNRYASADPVSTVDKDLQTFL